MASVPSIDHPADMKRVSSGILWAFVVVWVGSYVALYVGFSTAWTIPLGVAAGSFVTFDPMHRIWQVPIAVTSPRTLGGTGSAGAPTLEPARQR